MQAVYSALRQGYIYILSRVDRLAALKGAAEPRKRRLKAQWFYMSKIIYLFIYSLLVAVISIFRMLKYFWRVCCLPMTCLFSVF